MNIINLKTTSYWKVALQLALAGLFLWSGTSKALSGFSAAGYLQHATAGPLADVFQIMAGSPVVDFLVVFGEIGIGLALLSGVLFRFGCWSGMAMMTLFYLSALPPETGPINNQVMYFLLLGWLQQSGSAWELPLASQVLSRWTSTQ